MLIPIGEFSKMTHLSVRQLRNYHEAGLLQPAAVDPVTGYRSYALDQVERARTIRMLRAVEMPVAMVAETLDGDRTAAIERHLTELERTVRDHGAAIAELREELAGTPAPAVELRAAPAQRVLAARARVARDDIDAWCAATYPELAERAARAGAWPSGPAGADYAEPFFADNAGAVTAWLPVAEPTRTGRAAPQELPGGRYAVAVHRGAYSFDRTYAALGRALHDDSHPLGVEPAAGAVREIYLVGPDKTHDPTQWITEVCWPVRPRTDERK